MFCIVYIVITRLYKATALNFTYFLHNPSYGRLSIRREPGLNPDKLGKIDNHKQEPWKAPLPQFIEEIYFKRFKKEAPEVVKPLKQILKELETKKQQKKKEKDKKRKEDAMQSIIDDGKVESSV